MMKHGLPFALVMVAMYITCITTPCEGVRWEFSPDAQDLLYAQTVRAKYDDRIPVVVRKAPRSQIADIDKTRFLVPSDLTVAQFMYIIRRRTRLSPEKPMFLFVNKASPSTSSTMGGIYEDHKAQNGCLYVYYSGENTFQ